MDWTEERTCFEGVAAELALFYSTLPLDQGEEETDTPAATPTTPRSPRSAAPASPRAPGTTPASRKGKASRQSPAAGAGAGAAALGREDAGLASAGATAVVQHVVYPAFRCDFSSVLTQVALVSDTSPGFFGADVFPDCFLFNPFRTAFPFWGQTNQRSSSLSPKRDCGSKWVELVLPSGSRIPLLDLQ